MPRGSIRRGFRTTGRGYPGKDLLDTLTGRLGAFPLFRLLGRFFSGVRRIVVLKVQVRYLRALRGNGRFRNLRASPYRLVLYLLEAPR